MSEYMSDLCMYVYIYIYCTYIYIYIYIYMQLYVSETVYQTKCQIYTVCKNVCQAVSQRICQDKSVKYLPESMLDYTSKLCARIN